jgi:hypothetical protein
MKMNDLYCTVEAIWLDIIRLRESWANSDILNDEFRIPGYDLFQKDRKGNHKVGGVLLYIKSELKATEFTPRTAFPEQV